MKHLFFMLIAILIIAYFFQSDIQNDLALSEVETIEIEVVETIEVETIEVETVKVETAEVETVEIIHQINEHQIIIDQAYIISSRYDLPLDIVLRVIEVESNFDVLAESDGGDLGLMQINSRYIDYWIEKMEIETFNPYNSFENIEMGCFILAEYRNYWSEKGYSGVKLWKLTLSSYNTGLTSTIKNGVYAQYVDKFVSEFIGIND